MGNNSPLVTYGDSIMEKPYLITEKIVYVKEYNPNYGDDRICECGHKYYRHFDSYVEMDPVGCKYCACNHFVEFHGDYDVVKKELQEKHPAAWNHIKSRFSEDGRFNEALMLEALFEERNFIL